MDAKSNTYTERRRETLHSILERMLRDYADGDWQVGTFEAWREEILAFVEKEVKHAYGRGRHPKGSASENGRRPGEIRSAVRNGKLTPSRPAKWVTKHPAE